MIESGTVHNLVISLAHLNLSVLNLAFQVGYLQIWKEKKIKTKHHFTFSLVFPCTKHSIYPEKALH